MQRGSVESHVEPVAGQRDRHEWHGHRRAGWALLACWILFLGSVLVLGARTSTLAHLQDDIASGDVESVTIAGGLHTGARGFATVEVQWRQGIFQYTTKVLESQPLAARRPRATRDEVTAVVGPDLGAQLQAQDPGLEVVHESFPLLPASSLGWRFPEWAALAFLGLVVSSYLMLIFGPRPWRATKWAWFWLFGVAPPLGVFAYLLLAGPTSIVPGPKDTNRRLTGGWAFLISLLLGSALMSNS